MANRIFEDIKDIAEGRTTRKTRDGNEVSIVLITEHVTAADYIQICKDYMACYAALSAYIEQLEQYCEDNRWDTGICLIDGYIPSEGGGYQINQDNLIQKLKEVRDDMLRPISLDHADLKKDIDRVKADVTNTTKSYIEKPAVHKHKSWFLSLLDRFLVAITGRSENEHVIQPVLYKAIHNATKSLAEVHRKLFHPPEKEHRESDFYAPPAKGM